MKAQNQKEAGKGKILNFYLLNGLQFLLLVMAFNQNKYEGNERWEERDRSC